MNEEQRSLLLKTSSRFPPPQGQPYLQSKTHFFFSSFHVILEMFTLMFWWFSGVKLSYGTAGFRADASILESTVYRVGILAALRSLKTKSVIGLMITASHNKVSDNGVKIADPSGGMLTQNWEPFADALANASDPGDLVRVAFYISVSACVACAFCSFFVFVLFWNIANELEREKLSWF